MSIVKNTLSRCLPLLLAGAPLIGCASSQAPKELVDARAAYTRAQSGYARELSPASLHDAKTALDSAERMFSDDGDNDATRDLAYVAARKAEFAESEGTTSHFQRELQSTKDRHGQEQAKAAASAQSELVRTREQLASEQTARKAAEQRSKEALDRLAAANAAAVKQEDRGTVITLSGNVLFASGKAALLPGAQSGLEQVAEALKARDDTKILVEGHTDSTGSAATNQALSKARADAVGSFLVTRGLPSDRVTTAGIGPSRPVADNNTPEGRANNRRVEIVIQTVEKR